MQDQFEQEITPIRKEEMKYAIQPIEENKEESNI